MGLMSVNGDLRVVFPAGQIKEPQGRLCLRSLVSKNDGMR